ncbi:hypothetical protein O9929_24230 [Vibrio lentus]|nr:hypothetical protein [Vibrio lentus]
MVHNQQHSALGRNISTNSISGRWVNSDQISIDDLEDNPQVCSTLFQTTG